MITSTGINIEICSIKAILYRWQGLGVIVNLVFGGPAGIIFVKGSYVDL